MTHKNQLKTLDEQYQNQIETIKQTHKQEFIECQQKTEKLLVNRSHPRGKKRTFGSCRNHQDPLFPP